MGIIRTLTINGEKYDVIPVVPADSVTLLESAWVGDGDTYSQRVELPNVSACTKVDLQPTPQQLEEFHYKTLAFVAENEGGRVTVYSVGDKPAGDYTIQVTLTEVEGGYKIRGNTVGTTMPRANLEQTDPTQADYVNGKDAFVEECVSHLRGELADYEQLKPEFANSIEECTDTTKLYVLPDGYIYAYMAHEEYPFTNQIPLSVDTDKTVYNGFGYKSGYRINREGLEVEQSGDAVTGFIPIKVGDVLHFKNIDYKPGNTVTAGYLAFYNGNFENIQAARDTDGLDAISFVVDAYTTDETTGQLTSLTVRDKYNDGVSYFRISSPQLDNTSIITLNEEITGEPVVTYSWTNTGHAFVPADYEDRIIKAENDIATLKKVIAGDIAVYGMVDEENNIVMTGTLTPGKYSLKYMNEDGTTTDIGEFTMW